MTNPAAWCAVMALGWTGCILFGLLVAAMLAFHIGALPSLAILGSAVYLGLTH